MDNTKAVFFVGDIMKDRAGNTVYAGYPTKERAVYVGDKFILRYEIPVTLDDILNERPLRPPINCRKVELTVIKIDSMRQLIDELPSGVTGALYLSGKGLEYVGKKTLLET